MIPLLGIPPIHSIDRSISLIIAFSMVALGLRTGKVWASVLLGIPSKDEKTLIKQVFTFSYGFDGRFLLRLALLELKNTECFKAPIDQVWQCLLFA